MYDSNSENDIPSYGSELLRVVNSLQLAGWSMLIGAPGSTHFDSRDGLLNLAGNLVTVRSVSSTKVSYSDSYNPKCNLNVKCVSRTTRRLLIDPPVIF